MAAEFSDLVRKRRLELHRTARDFYREKSVSCTYAYYSKVENGTLPDIEIALELIDKLGLNQTKALYAWTRDHMPSAETKALFDQPDEEAALSAEQKVVGRSLVVNRMQAKFLHSHPMMWEILMFLSAFYGRREWKSREIAMRFGVAIPDMDRHLTALYDYGLLDKAPSGNFVTREWIFIPYEDEFRPLRDQNFRQAFDQFTRVDPAQQLRTTITVPLLPQHQKVIEARVLSLTNAVIDLSERETTANAVPYTIGVFASPRKFGPVRK